MPDRRVIFEPFAKQDEFIQAFLSGKFYEMVYGGAIRGGKSYLGISLILLLCKLFPGSRWAIMRANLPRIRQNVLPIFGKLRPNGFCADVNKSSWSATCNNGSEILFLPESIKDDPDLNKMRGFEVNGFLLEECNEMTRKLFHAAQERAGTWIVPGLAVQPPSFIMGTCNPGQSWVKEDFHDPAIAGKLANGRYFLQATADDNPHITDEQKERWKSLPPHLYRRYVLGDWTVTDDPMQIVPYEDLYPRLVDPEDVPGLLRETEGDESLGVDYGGIMADEGRRADKAVLAHMRDAFLYEFSRASGLTQGQVASLVSVAMSERLILPGKVGIDAVGEGSGVWGNLKDMGLHVQRIMAGGAPWVVGRSDTEKSFEMQFRNFKTQMWWQLRRDVMDPDSGFRMIHDAKAVQDILAYRYRVAGERLLEVEPKDDLKKRIGRSPDDGDAAVIANFLRQIRPLEVASVESRDMPETQFIKSIWS